MKDMMESENFGDMIFFPKSLTNKGASFFSVSSGKVEKLAFEKEQKNFKLCRFGSYLICLEEGEKQDELVFFTISDNKLKSVELSQSFSSINSLIDQDPDHQVQILSFDIDESSKTIAVHFNIKNKDLNDSVIAYIYFLNKGKSVILSIAKIINQ